MQWSGFFSSTCENTLAGQATLITAYSRGKPGTGKLAVTALSWAPSDQSLKALSNLQSEQILNKAGKIIERAMV